MGLICNIKLLDQYTVKAVGIILIMGLFLVSCIGGKVVSGEADIIFPDPNLDVEIRRAIEKDDIGVFGVIDELTAGVSQR